METRDLVIREREARATFRTAAAKYEQALAGATPEELAVAEAAVATAASKRDAAISAKADAVTALANAWKNHENAVAKADSLLESKRAALVLEMEEALSLATDAVVRLTGPMFTSDDQLTFSSTSGIAENDARNTRRYAKAALDDIAAAVVSAKADESMLAALAAQAQVSAGLATVKLHLEACIELFKYALNMDASTKSTYQLNANAGLANANASLQSLSALKSDIDLQQKLNDAEVTAARTAVSNAESAVSAATFAIDTAERSLAQAENQLAEKEAPLREVDKAVFEAAVAAAQAGLDLVRQQLADATLLAPTAGIVTSVDAEKGELVTPARRVAAMISSGLEIETDVSELDIRKLSVAMAAEATFDALGPARYAGKIREIAAREKLKDEDIFYRVVVALDDPLPELRSGMTADLSFEIGEKSGVLVVPERLVLTRGGKTYLRLLRDGKVEETEVAVGLRGVDLVEIVDGAAEGDQVIVREQE